MAGFALPLPNNPIRDLFDMETVIEILNPANLSKMRTLRDVLLSVNSKPWPDGVRSQNFVCMKADGSIVLEQVGPKGGHKTIWKFC
jgi:hypothetical protein